MKEHYEQHEKLSTAWSWALVFVLGTFVMTVAMVLHHMIPESPRQWDFGQKPDTPALSVYSTSQPAEEGYPPQKQLEPLPAASQPADGGGLRP